MSFDRFIDPYKPDSKPAKAWQWGWLTGLVQSVKDENGLGRVKIQCPQIDPELDLPNADDQQVWVLEEFTCNETAGGSHRLLKPGTLVAFLPMAGDLSKVLVLGCLPNQRDRPPIGLDRAEETYGHQTPGGVTHANDDKDGTRIDEFPHGVQQLVSGKGEITQTTKGNARIDMKPDGAMSIGNDLSHTNHDKEGTVTQSSGGGAVTKLDSEGKVEVKSAGQANLNLDGTNAVIQGPLDAASTATIAAGSALIGTSARSLGYLSFLQSLATQLVEGKNLDLLLNEVQEGLEGITEALNKNLPKGLSALGKLGSIDPKLLGKRLAPQLADALDFDYGKLFKTVQGVFNSDVSADRLFDALKQNLPTAFANALDIEKLKPILETLDHSVDLQVEAVVESLLPKGSAGFENLKALGLHTEIGKLQSLLSNPLPDASTHPTLLTQVVNARAAEIRATLPPELRQFVPDATVKDALLNTATRQPPVDLGSSSALLAGLGGAFGGGSVADSGDLLGSALGNALINGSAADTVEPIPTIDNVPVKFTSRLDDLRRRQAQAAQQVPIAAALGGQFGQVDFANLVGSGSGAAELGGATGLFLSATGESDTLGALQDSGGNAIAAADLFGSALGAGSGSLGSGGALIVGSDAAKIDGPTLDGVPIKLTSRLQDLRERLGGENAFVPLDIGVLGDDSINEDLGAGFGAITGSGVSELTGGLLGGAFIAGSNADTVGSSSDPGVLFGYGAASTARELMGLGSAATRIGVDLGAFGSQTDRAEPLSLSALYAQRRNPQNTDGLEAIVGTALGGMVAKTEQSAKAAAGNLNLIGLLQTLIKTLQDPKRSATDVAPSLEALVTALPGLPIDGSLSRDFIPAAIRAIGQMLRPALQETLKGATQLLEAIPSNIKGAVMRAGQNFLEGLADEQGIGGLLHLAVGKSELLGPVIPADKLGPAGGLLGNLASKALSGLGNSSIAALAAPVVQTVVNNQTTGLAQTLGNAALAYPGAQEFVSQVSSTVSQVSGIVGMVGETAVADLTRAQRSQVRADDNGAGIESPWGGFGFSADGMVGLAKKISLAAVGGGAALEMNEAIGVGLSAMGADGKPTAQIGAKDGAVSIAAVGPDGKPIASIGATAEGLKLNDRVFDWDLIDGLLKRIADLETQLAAMTPPSSGV